MVAAQRIVTEEDVVNSIEYIKQYWRDPRHWSTPRGMINLSIIFQVCIGMWFFHNTFWHMYEVPSWATCIIMAFAVVKFPFYSAFVVNKRATPFMYGTLAGASAVMILNSFCTSIFWARSAGCHDSAGKNLITTRHCSDILIDSMKTEFHLSWIVFALQLHFAYLVFARDDVDVDEARTCGAGRFSIHQRQVCLCSCLSAMGMCAYLIYVHVCMHMCIYH